MTSEILGADEVFSLFKKDAVGEMTFGDLANQLGITIEELENMSMGEIEAKSKEVAKNNADRIQNSLDKRDKIFSDVGNKGITQDELTTETRMYFDGLLKDYGKQIK